MVQSLDYLHETASQTAGPYVHIGLIPHQAGFDVFEKNWSNDLTKDGAQGTRIRIEGRVFDGAGSVCKDILVEIWQADADGKYPTSAGGPFRGWGRTGTDFQTGVYAFETIKPGSVPGRHGKGPMAPHVNVWLAARGINIGLSTRLYFSDEEEANAKDPVLRLIEQEQRRRTLIARHEEREGGAVYVFDIRLQGEGETVFFDI